MKKKLFIFLTFAYLFILSLDFFISYKFMIYLFQSINLRKYESQKIYQYENFLSQLKDLEIGHMGYVLTDKPYYLMLYKNALKNLESKELKNFFNDEVANSNSETSIKIEKIQELTQSKLDQIKDVIDKKNQAGFEKAQKSIIQNREKQVLQNIRQIINSLKKEKKNNLDAIEEAVKEATRDNTLALLVGYFIIALLLTSCLIYIYVYIRKLASKEKELSQAMQKLQESLAIRQAVLNSTSYTIVATNQEGIITLFNSAAEKMLGYSSEELVGKSTPEVFHDKKEIEERAFQLFKKHGKKITPGFEVFVTLAKAGTTDTNEWTLIRKDGTRLPAELSVTPIKNELHQTVGFLGVLYDITERKKLEQMKDELIALSSFEIREPLAAIKGAFDLLFLKEYNNLPEAAKRVLEIGKKNCENLVNFTKDILELQKLETGKIDFNFKKVDLSIFLSQIVQINTITAKEAHVLLSFSPLNFSCMIEADEDRMTGAMNHLVAAAINYSPIEGTVKITAQKINYKVRIEINNQDLSQRFNPTVLKNFDLGSSITYGSKSENDLRIRIAKSIIEKHQGIMGFQSSFKGTSFWLELPIAGNEVL